MVSPGQYMTESQSQDIASVVKILAPLICHPLAAPLTTGKCTPEQESTIFPLVRDRIGGFAKNIPAELKKQMQDVAMAVMAESVSRAARVYVKVQHPHNPARTILLWSVRMYAYHTVITVVGCYVL